MLCFISCARHLDGDKDVVLKPPKVRKGQRWAATTDLAGQFIHKGHNGVLEECGSGQRSLGDLSDAQVAIWPHLLQDLARTAKTEENE